MKKILLSILTLGTTLAYSQKLSFDAKGIIVISDADMAASAFVDGKLFRIIELLCKKGITNNQLSR